MKHLQQRCWIKPKTPIGQVIMTGGEEPFTVVGVVKDYHSNNFKEKIEPIFFSLDAHGDLLNTYIKYLPGKEKEATAAIAKAYKTILPYGTFESYNMEDWLMRRYEEDAQWKKNNYSFVNDCHHDFNPGIICTHCIVCATTGKGNWYPESAGRICSKYYFQCF